MLFCVYADHEASHNSYKFQKYDLSFHQTFCFDKCGYFISVFQVIVFLFWQVIMNTLIVYATLTPIHNFLMCRHLIELGWKIFRNSEARIIIYFSYLASLRPPLYDRINMLLYSSMVYTYNIILGTNSFSVLLSMESLGQSFSICDCTTCGWCKTQLYRSCFSCALIFVCNFCLGVLKHNALSIMVAFSFVLAAPNLQTFFFIWHPILLEITW